MWRQNDISADCFFEVYLVQSINLDEVENRSQLCLSKSHFAVMSHFDSSDGINDSLCSQNDSFESIRITLQESDKKSK